MLTFCNSYVLWLLRCVKLHLVTVTFCDVNDVWWYVLSQYRRHIYLSRSYSATKFSGTLDKTYILWINKAPRDETVYECIIFIVRIQKILSYYSYPEKNEVHSLGGSWYVSDLDFAATTVEETENKMASALCFFPAIFQML